MKTEISNVDILAISAHPDDVELNAGGFTALLAKQGKTVGMLDLTRGEMGTRGTAEIRHEESIKAAGIIGASFRANLDMPDSKLMMTLEYKEKIAAAIRKAKPKFCLVSYFSAKHPDHAIAGQLVHEAAWIAGLTNYDLEGEAHRPSRVFFYPSRYEFQPKFIVDVTEVWDIKKKACMAYSSQFYKEGSSEPETEIASKTFFDFIEARARNYGRKIGAEYGEPYFMHEEVSLDDPFSLIEKDRF